MSNIATQAAELKLKKSNFERLQAEFKQAEKAESISCWFNYKTNQKDYREPITDEIALEYIPQHNSAQDMYRIYRENLGFGIPEALAKILEIAAKAYESKNK